MESRVGETSQKINKINPAEVVANRTNVAAQYNETFLNDNELEELWFDGVSLKRPIFKDEVHVMGFNIFYAHLILFVTFKTNEGD